METKDKLALLAGIAAVVIAAAIIMGGREEPPAPSPTPIVPTATPAATPTPTPSPTPEPTAAPPCNNDKYCDENETLEGCYGDCMPVQCEETSGGTFCSNKTFYNNTRPTIGFDVYWENGVAECASGVTDASKWDCVVDEPGATTTKVSCTLTNYFFDGSYNINLYCKDNGGENIPVIRKFDIMVCASELGCMR